MSEFNESIETPEISDEDLQGLIDHHGGELPSYHPILQIWREVLNPARKEKNERVTPAWANRIVASYQGVTFADMEVYRDSYFGKILQLLNILELEIDAISTPFESVTTPEDDVETYGLHYQNLLLTWQLAILQWELDWRTTADNAATEVAAISEVHKMFFGPTGLTGFLDNIKFEFTEDDQASMAEALEALKAGR